MMNRTYSLKILLCLLVSFALSGCWSSQEINNLAIINAIGVDQNEAGDVVLTVSVIKPTNLFSQETMIQEDKKDSYLIETASGKNLFEAMGKISSAVSEKIYLGQINAVVFGEKAARQGMESYLDFFKRENHFRPNMLLFVSKGLAENVIKATPTLNPTPATEMHDLSKNNRFSAIKTVKDLSKFTESMSSNTIDPVTAVIRSAEDRGIKIGRKNQSHESNVEKQDIPEILSIQETAVFKGSKLVGFLNQSESRGLMWLQGEGENTNVMLDCGNQDHFGMVSLLIRHSNSSKIPSMDNRKMNVNIEADADIVEFTCKNSKLDSKQLNRLNKRFQKKIKEEAMQTLSLAQKNWETDIFGFGRAIYRKHPTEWDQLASTWRNGGLKALNVDLKIQANISRYGLTSQQSKANESR